MPNDESMEISRSSRAARAREKKAGISSLLLTTVGFLIVACVILYSIFNYHTGSGRKSSQDAKGPVINPSGNSHSQGNVPVANSNSQAPQSPPETGGANSASNPDPQDTTSASHPDSTTVTPETDASTPSTSNQPLASDTNNDSHSGTTPPIKTPTNSGTLHANQNTHSASQQQSNTGNATSSASNQNSNVKLPTTYVVRKGDTLSTISMRFYHSKHYVSLLMNHNDIALVNQLTVGTTLHIPALSSGAKGNSGKQDDVDYTGVKLPAAYLVRPGDTFYAISKRFYGSGQYASFIAKHNKLDETRGLEAGSSIMIPIKPAK